MSSDTIHPSKDGHLIYAKYIRYIINTIDTDYMIKAPLLSTAGQIKELPAGQIFGMANAVDPNHDYGPCMKTAASGTIGAVYAPSKDYVDNKLATKQKVFITTSPVLVYASPDDITYAVDDIIYYNNKLYRYTGYTPIESGGHVIYYEAQFDVLGAKNAFSIRDPNASEVVSNGGVSSYNVGDTHIKIRDTSTTAIGIFICSRVTKSVDVSTMEITYTYLWDQLATVSS